MGESIGRWLWLAVIGTVIVGCDVHTSRTAARRNKIEIPQSALYGAESVEQLPYVVELSATRFADHMWTDSDLLANLQQAAHVYGQCGLRFAGVTIYESNLRSDQLSRWEPESEAGYISLGRKSVIEKPRPMVLLIGGFADAEASAFALADYTTKAGAQYPELYNTIFLPDLINSDQYRREREASPYSTLAHELLHILTRDGEHNNDPTPNLLTIWRRRSNLITDEQCEQVHHSAIVAHR